MNVMDKILIILLFTVLLFVVIVLFFNYQGLQVQDSLINMFMGMIATELVSMGGIQIFKGRSKTLPKAGTEVKSRTIKK